MYRRNARPTISFSDLWAFRKEAMNNGDEAQAALCTLAIGGRAALRAGEPGTAEYQLWKSKRTQASARHECAVLKADAEAEARHNPGFGDYLAAGRRHLATGLTKAAEEAQRAAERARAAADREAKRRQCDAPTPEQALRVLAQAIGVEKLNPRQNGSYYAATDSYGDTAYGVGTTASAALRDARQWYDGNTGALSVDRISRARYLAIKGGNAKASGTRRRNGTIKMSSPRTTEAYERLLIAEAGAPRGQAMSDWQRDATASDVRKGWLSHYGALPEWAKPARRARKNGFSSHPFGWAQVQGGHVVKVSDAQRKPKGTGWGAIETSGTRIGSSAYLDRNGTVYLR
jgi:hypothetical protein